MQLRRLWPLAIVVLATACGNTVVPEDTSPDRGAAVDSGTDARIDTPADRPIAIDVPSTDTPIVADTRVDVGADRGVIDGGRDVATDTPDVVDGGPRCARDMDCAAMTGFTRCDIARGRCVECVPVADTCAAGSYCSPMTYTCVSGCRSDFDCSSGESCCAGACVSTAADLMRCGSCTRVCGATNAAPVCVGGNCVENCTAGFGDCDRDPGTGCETATSDNPMNCGACGRVCSFPNAASACTAGACSILACNAGFTNCDGMIANGCESQTATDLRNCGTCGTICATGQSCNTGRCECPAGQVVCAGRCVNPLTDLTNCGACGMVCATGSTCSAAGCACPAGQVVCAGRCVNTMTDVNHCGTCGIACGATMTCTGGTCGCPAGTSLCGTRCINTSTDAMNCGSCGRVCAAGEVCYMSACTTAPPIRYTLLTGSSFPFIDACTAPGRVILLAGVDDDSAASTLPFPVRYWATDLPAGAPIRISSNGHIFMNGTGSASLSGSVPPGGGVGQIAAHWSDLVLTTGICVATIGTAPNRQFVLEWLTARYFGATATLTFEIVINEGTNIIDMAYETMTGARAAGTGLTSPMAPNMISGCPAGMTTCLPAAGTRLRFQPSP